MLYDTYRHGWASDPTSIVYVYPFSLSRCGHRCFTHHGGSNVAASEVVLILIFDLSNPLPPPVSSGLSRCMGVALDDDPI